MYPFAQQRLGPKKHWEGECLTRALVVWSIRGSFRVLASEALEKSPGNTRFALRLFRTGVSGIYMAGSTIPLPPKKLRFSLTSVSGLLDIRKDAIDRKVSTCFLVCKGLSIDDVWEGVEGHRNSRRYDRELVLKPAVSLKKS